MRLAVILSSLLAVAAHVMHAQTEHCTPGEGIVCAPAGGLHGVVEDGVISYRGIPYAQAPIGLRRWRPPLPMEPWSGVRDALRFGPMCPQVAGNDVVGDEDCLTLNVWVPRMYGGFPGYSRTADPEMATATFHFESVTGLIEDVSAPSIVLNVNYSKLWDADMQEGTISAIDPRGISGGPVYRIEDAVSPFEFELVGFIYEQKSSSLHVRFPG